MTRPPSDTHCPALRIVVLGSGSSGNATAIAYDGTLVLVDCGFSARETANRLSTAGLEPAEVSAILVTHEHGDHVKGIDVFARRYAPGCTVYATPGTLRRMALNRSVECRCADVVDGFSVGALSVHSFETSHDAAQPVGYRIEAGGDVFGVATDSGVLTPAALDGLRDATVLGLEFNHDVDMLERGPYPYHLKRRILSEQGHLSNADAASALERLAHGGLNRVIALHRSHTNNTADLAAGALRAALERLGHPAAAEVARQHGVSVPAAPCVPTEG
ncbi:MAG: MBL fold metallo-hydrolase [Coriobacteriia bacterium]|nr:MBL fold metallo-hydrolase [Coriobacteriia bacterium]